MYVEVLDHARHDGGGLGRAIGFSRQDSVARSPHGTRLFGRFLLPLPLKLVFDSFEAVRKNHIGL